MVAEGAVLATRIRLEPNQAFVLDVQSRLLFLPPPTCYATPRLLTPHRVVAVVTPGRYLEIFARKNNLRNYWVSIGNEVTGTGLPDEDMQVRMRRRRRGGRAGGLEGGWRAAKGAQPGGAGLACRGLRRSGQRVVVEVAPRSAQWSTMQAQCLPHDLPPLLTPGTTHHRVAPQALRDLHHIPGAVYGKNGGGGGGPSNGGAAPPASRGPSGGGAAPPAAARAAAAKPPLPLGPTAAAAAAASAAASTLAEAAAAAAAAGADGEVQQQDVDLPMPQAEDAGDALPTPLAAPPPAEVAAAAQRQGAGGAGAGPGAGEPEDVSIGLGSLPSLGMLESALRSGGVGVCGGGGGALETCARGGGGGGGGGRPSVGPGLSGLSAGPLRFD